MNELATQDQKQHEIMEKVIAEGDLSKLSSQERMFYYNKTCESLGLNPITRPFEYIRLNGKMVLYARKDCTEQLRGIHKVSITKMDVSSVDGVHVVTAYARSASGKEDVATGAVTTKGLQGENLANALMKAETKAKRRVTLSICGLGFMDETEIEDIQDVTPKADELNQMLGLDDSPMTVEQHIEEFNACNNIEDLAACFEEGKGDWKSDKESMKRLIEAKDRNKARIEMMAEVDVNDLVGM